jgi:hypothetical protein
VGVSSANIPAVSFVISADLPARYHQGNDPAYPDLSILAGKSQIKRRRCPFPIVIASNSQLEEAASKMLLNGILL